MKWFAVFVVAQVFLIVSCKESKDAAKAAEPAKKAENDMMMVEAKKDKASAEAKKDKMTAEVKAEFQNLVRDTKRAKMWISTIRTTQSTVACNGDIGCYCSERRPCRYSFHFVECVNNRCQAQTWRSTTPGAYTGCYHYLGCFCSNSVPCVRGLQCENRVCREPFEPTSSSTLPRTTRRVISNEEWSDEEEEDEKREEWQKMGKNKDQ